MSGHDEPSTSSLRVRANDANNCSVTNNSNNIFNHNGNNNNRRNTEELFIETSDELLSLKVESDMFLKKENKLKKEDNLENEDQDIEEKEKEIISSDSETISHSNKNSKLSFCRGLNKTPLAVPMIADTLQQSVTRNDAKAITETRLKRLKALSQRPEDSLTKGQKTEKKRIIRLEKNRRAAAMSRLKKKMYVKNLEQKTELMGRHLAILEMENSHLRALVTANNMQQMATFKMPHFQVPPNFNLSSNNSEINNNSTNLSSANGTNTSSLNSLEPITTNTSSINGSEDVNNDNSSNVPSIKRRKLNDGSSCSLNTTTPSPSCDNSDDISILEPLPIKTNDNNNMVPSHGPPRFMPIPPNVHPSRLMLYRPHPGHPQHPHFNHPHYRPSFHPHPHINHTHNIPQNGGYHGIQPNHTHLLPTIDDTNDQDLIEKSEHKSVENEEMNNEMPPEIAVPPLMPNEYLSMLDDDIIDETVDECGSVIGFQHDIKENDIRYI